MWHKIREYLRPSKRMTFVKDMFKIKFYIVLKIILYLYPNDRAH
jgi:hypothetical protein